MEKILKLNFERKKNIDCPQKRTQAPQTNRHVLNVSAIAHILDTHLYSCFDCRSIMSLLRIFQTNEFVISLHFQIMDRSHLSMDIKQKIIALRNNTSLTFAEIAEQCGCSVSNIILILNEPFSALNFHPPETISQHFLKNCPVF